MRLLASIAIGIAVGAIVAGCADPNGEGQSPRPKRINERRQARERDTQTLLAYCATGRARSASAAVPSRRDARAAIDTLLAQVPEYDGSSYARQYLVRRTLASLASLLERRRCLTDEVPHIDRALRWLSLPDPREPPPTIDDGSGYDDEDQWNP